MHTSLDVHLHHQTLLLKSQWRESLTQWHLRISHSLHHPLSAMERHLTFFTSPPPSMPLPISIPTQPELTSLIPSQPLMKHLFHSTGWLRHFLLWMPSINLSSLFSSLQAMERSKFSMYPLKVQIHRSVDGRALLVSLLPIPVLSWTPPLPLSYSWVTITASLTSLNPHQRNIKNLARLKWRENLC